MHHVIIASQNPVKINAASIGFETMFSDQLFTFEGIQVDSGVADQPHGDEETLQGALNRVKNARHAKPDADYWVGIEGGTIDHEQHGMSEATWVAITSKEGITGKAKTPTFFLPPQIAEHIRSGKTLAEADNLVFERTDSNMSNGAVGFLTNNMIDRTEYCSIAVMLALVSFVHPQYYTET